MASASSAALYLAVSSPLTKQAEPEDTAELKHHLKDGKGFRNPWPSYIDFTPPRIMKQMLWRIISGKANKPDTTPPTVPVHKPNFLPTRQTSSMRATWLGHACYYVEFPSGLRVLFDPVFTPRCSPFSFMGPKRYTDIPCEIDDIPFIDAVVISHSHYDHLSYPTVLKIKQKHPGAHFFAPLGNKKWFTSCGIDNMTELDWWEDRDIRLTPSQPNPSAATSAVTAPEKPGSAPSDAIAATISCLPSQHTSARTPFNKNATLWASWSVRSGGASVYFAGDTGYRTVTSAMPDAEGASKRYTPELHGPLPHCPAFAQIGALRGPFDLGLIPIGAYAPRDIMSPMHANPWDAANIFNDARCARALAMHWGTWVLTEEDVLEPPRLLRDALRSMGLAETGLFDVCDIGESTEFPVAAAGAS